MSYISTQRAHMEGMTQSHKVTKERKESGNSSTVTVSSPQRAVISARPSCGSLHHSCRPGRTVTCRAKANKLPATAVRFLHQHSQYPTLGGSTFSHCDQLKLWWSQKLVPAWIELEFLVLETLSSFYLDYNGPSYHYTVQSSNPYSVFQRKIKTKKTQHCVSQPTVQNCSQQRKFLQ